MKLRVDREGVYLRLSVSGCEAIDSANAAELKAEALKLLGDSPDVVVDLTGVDFVDSAGVGVLVSLFKHARSRGGRARYCGLTPGVRSVLELLQLDRILEIHDDVRSTAGSSTITAAPTASEAETPPRTPRST